MLLSYSYKNNIYKIIPVFKLNIRDPLSFVLVVVFLVILKTILFRIGAVLFVFFASDLIRLIEAILVSIAPRIYRKTILCQQILF